MSRIAQTFESLAANDRTALIPYVVAGDPEPGLTVEVMHALVKAGADIIELGVPFSDPMAEGVTISLGHERALEHGISLTDCLQMAAKFREEDQQTPLILMGYANPVSRMGFERFTEAASAAGIDGLITVDMPPEEVGPLNDKLAAASIDNIFLVAPTTPAERIERIVDAATGFIYCVALKGVTGAAHLDTQAVADRVAEIRTHSELPVAVGFGIKDADSAAAVADTADAVVVGSALVQLMADVYAQAGTGEAMVAAVTELIASIRAGIDAGDVGQ